MGKNKYSQIVDYGTEDTEWIKKSLCRVKEGSNETTKPRELFKYADKTLTVASIVSKLKDILDMFT